MTKAFPNGRHWADGYRCYDGCPDSTMQRRLDAEAALLEELKKYEPEARITWFPVEGQFQAHVWGRPLSGMCNSRVAAINEALGACRNDHN